jgi:hypothetical protein
MNKIVRIDKTPERYDLAGKVIGFAIKVHSNLGSGFLGISLPQRLHSSRAPCLISADLEAKKPGDLESGKLSDGGTCSVASNRAVAAVSDRRI